MFNFSVHSKAFHFSYLLNCFLNNLYFKRGSKDGLNTDDSLSNQLQQLILKLATNKLCLTNMPLFKSNIMYCAKHQNENSNICYGDSGGPLMQINNNNKWYIHGITSTALAFQNYSCNPQKPSYYTKVSSYSEWIRTKIIN